MARDAQRIIVLVLTELRGCAPTIQQVHDTELVIRREFGGQRIYIGSPDRIERPRRGDRARGRGDIPGRSARVSGR